MSRVVRVVTRDAGRVDVLPLTDRPTQRETPSARASSIAIAIAIAIARVKANASIDRFVFDANRSKSIASFVKR